MTNTDTYFKNNNEKFFDMYIPNTLNCLKKYQKNILDKYPSRFFTKWIDRFEPSSIFNKDLIYRIRCGDAKYSSLLIKLCDSKYYKTKKQITELIKCLMDSNLLNMAILVSIYISDDSVIVNMISDEKILLRLKQMNFDQNILDKKLLMISKKYETIKDIMTNYEYCKPEFLSLCSPDMIIKFCIDKNNKHIISTKFLQQLLSYACIYKTYDLIIYFMKIEL